MPHKIFSKLVYGIIRERMCDRAAAPAPCLFPPRSSVFSLVTTRGRLGRWLQTMALFSFKNFSKIDTIIFSFVFDKYCSIID